jgi:tetratricopeptide (TPR) repeat protein
LRLFFVYCSRSASTALPYCLSPRSLQAALPIFERPDTGQGREPTDPGTTPLGTPAHGSSTRVEPEYSLPDAGPARASHAAAAAEHRPAAALVDTARALSYSGEGTAQAIELLERAVESHPDDAEAWAELAGRYYEIAAVSFKGEPWAERARQAADRALELDPEQLARSVALSRIVVESGRAEEVARRGSDLAAAGPERAGAHFAIGYASRFGGLLERADREFRTVDRLEPGRASAQLAVVALQRGNHEEVFHFADEVIARRATAATLFTLMVAKALTDDRKSARRTAAAMAKLEPNSAYTIMGQVIVAGLEGRSPAALLGWLEEIRTDNGEVHYWLAQTHAFAGDLERSVSRLRQAILAGYFNAPYMESDRLLAPVRTHPEAAKLIEAARHRHERFAKRERDL